MLVYFSSAQLAQSQAVAPPALLPLLHVTMYEQKTIRSFWWQLPRLNSHSHALNSHSHPVPIPWLILLPFPWESRGTHGIPVFPIPMHTSTHDNLTITAAVGVLFGPRCPALLHRVDVGVHEKVAHTRLPAAMRASSRWRHAAATMTSSRRRGTAAAASATSDARGIRGGQLWWSFLSGSLALSNLYMYLLCSDTVNKLLSLSRRPVVRDCTATTIVMMMIIIFCLVKFS